LHLNDDGSLQGKLTITFTGLEALYRRLDQLNEDDQSRKKFLEDQVREYIPVSVDVELTNKPDWARSSDTLEAQFDLKVPGWASPAGRRTLIPVGLFGGTEKQLFEHAQRVHPVYFQFPFKKLDDVTIELPLGWIVGSTPKETNQDGKVITFTTKAEDDKGILHLQRALNVDFILVDPKSYSVLRRFFEGVRTSDEQQIVLQPAGATAKN
jgi:hypothetical protein